MEFWGMKDGLTNGQKMEWAKLLYTWHDISKSDIAARLNISEAELQEWIEEGKWDGLKKSLILTKDAQLFVLYELLQATITRIKSGSSDDPKDIDKVLKLTSSIKNLEGESGVADIIDVAKGYITWLQDEDPAEVLLTTQRFNKYIKYMERKH